MKLQDLIPLQESVLVEQYTTGHSTFNVEGRSFVVRNKKYFLKSGNLSDATYNVGAMDLSDDIKDVGGFVEQWLQKVAESVVRDFTSYPMSEKSASHFYVFVDGVSPHDPDADVEDFFTGTALVKRMTDVFAEHSSLQSNKWDVRAGGACVAITYLPKRADK